MKQSPCIIDPQFKDKTIDLGNLESQQFDSLDIGGRVNGTVINFTYTCPSGLNGDPSSYVSFKASQRIDSLTAANLKPNGTTGIGLRLHLSQFGKDANLNGGVLYIVGVSEGQRTLKIRPNLVKTSDTVSLGQTGEFTTVESPLTL